ncbi:hypothetical protein KC359_g63 [Hortaea werneckii]|nr:hypothetical protein KC359_g63 [Hortaea werneckii]
MRFFVSPPLSSAGFQTAVSLLSGLGAAIYPIDRGEAHGPARAVQILGGVRLTRYMHYPATPGDQAFRLVGFIATRATAGTLAHMPFPLSLLRYLINVTRAPTMLHTRNGRASMMSSPLVPLSSF